MENFSYANISSAKMIKQKFIFIAVFGYLLQSCIPYTTKETEVGVLVCKLSIGCAKLGVQDEIYPPGSTHFFLPLVRDFYTIDTKVQNLQMLSELDKGDREHADDLHFKTTDGNDISMDVTVVWALEGKSAPLLVQNIGQNTSEIKEKLVRPMARTYVRDVLNELDSESIYNADKRFEKAEKARSLLADKMSPYGVIISQVILHEHRFNPEYQKVIHDRKLAEQRAGQLKSEADAAMQEALRNLESARGKVASMLAEAQGELSKAKLEADAGFYREQQNADAILSEKTAVAKAIAQRNEALKGSGGRSMVKLKIAEALMGKRIFLVPGGETGIGINKLDVNQLFKGQVKAQAALE